MIYVKGKLFSRAIVGHQKNLNFVKGTLYNLQKKIQCQNESAILDGLLNARCGSFQSFRIILDESAWINTKRFNHFLHFGPHKTYSRITVSLLP